jgi:hypothetical protein
MMCFCHFFLFSDHCAILEFGYLKSGMITYLEMVRSWTFRINDLLLYICQNVKGLMVKLRIKLKNYYTTYYITNCMPESGKDMSGCKQA